MFNKPFFLFDQEKEKDPQGTEQQTFVHFLPLRAWHQLH